MAMTLVEQLAFDVASIMIGWLPNAVLSLAVHNVLLTLNVIVYSISIGRLLWFKVAATSVVEPPHVPQHYNTLPLDASMEKSQPSPIDNATPHVGFVPVGTPGTTTTASELNPPAVDAPTTLWTETKANFVLACPLVRPGALGLKRRPTDSP
ncbi:hypothetical protein H310_09934 [Aphanomyces invadans]|uniref:Uncharacterized protein n=1 Tax=Aphanomyces invadans TaxID=157072 RepID=A0A024TSY8_9STRA|nr:hypothetical protein H310_09934 [Aphanomyces invadans]ETV97129.1 hypothetical protein H310_09934 [Aphanomyces invadans]|eukprot:XP_008874375.1 hypothetical protein H310_09934 [Aphanomyces invadans]